jgi:hypothetical protein
MAGSSRGIALISVLWITGLLAVMAASFASSARTEARFRGLCISTASARIRRKAAFGVGEDADNVGPPLDSGVPAGWSTSGVGVLTGQR